MISTAPQSSTWKSTIKDSASILFLKKPTPYKPFYFPWAYEAWHLQQRIHWIPEEVSLAEDVQDWNSRLSPQEKNFLTQIFRFFTQADVEVSHCYMDYYSKIFCINEIKMMLAAFSNMETIHEAAYAYILDTVGMPEIEYEAFLNYKEMRSKWEYMQNFGGDTVEELALTLAFFGAFTEGLQLFASFAMLLNFTRFNKMKGMGQIVSWSIRDETIIPTLLFAYIIRFFKNILLYLEIFLQKKFMPWDKK
jgi:ribonucleoside-diphosphate reductase beta chain